MNYTAIAIQHSTQPYIICEKMVPNHIITATYIDCIEYSKIFSIPTWNSMLRNILEIHISTKNTLAVKKGAAKN